MSGIAITFNDESLKSITGDITDIRYSSGWPAYLTTNTIFTFFRQFLRLQITAALLAAHCWVGVSHKRDIAISQQPWTTPIWIIRLYRFQKEKQTWLGKKLYIATEPWAEASLLTIKVSIGKYIQNKTLFLFYSWRKERRSTFFPSLSCAEHQMCLNHEYEKRWRGKEGRKSKPGLEFDRKG